MNCPICKTEPLSSKVIEEKLEAFDCSSCHGIWLTADRYFDWLETHGETLPEKPFSEFSHQVTDVKNAKVCPSCGKILIKYQVGHGLDFLLDHCNGCNGVWLDENEWQALKGKNLHDEIHRIFTTPWQEQVKREARKQEIEAFYAATLGNNDYEELKRIKQWIDAHPRRATILAFLAEEKPYE